jgi:hypothetical protein
LSKLPNGASASQHPYIAFVCNGSNRDDPESMAMSGPAGSGQSAAAGAALVTAQSGMFALAGSRSCPDGEIDAMGHEQP